MLSALDGNNNSGVLGWITSFVGFKELLELVGIHSRRGNDDPTRGSAHDTMQHDINHRRARETLEGLPAPLLTLNLPAFA